MTLLLTYPVLPNGFQSLSIALFVISCIYFNWQIFKKNWNQIDWKHILILTAWFLLLALTIVYSPNKEKGFDYIIRGLSLILLPFIFLYFFPKISQKQKLFLFACFIILHILILCFIYYSIIKGIDEIGYFNENGKRIKGIFNSSWLNQFVIFIEMPFSVSRFYLNENEISEIFIHKAYLSMGYLWCILLMLYAVVRENISGYLKVLFVFLIFLFSTVVIYFTSIPNILALVVLVPIFTFVLIRKRIFRIWFVIGLSLMIMMFLNTSFVKEKIFQDKRLVHGIEESEQLLKSVFFNKKTDGSNIRLEVWKCSYNNIKDKWFLGYGLGSEESVLTKCYSKNNCDLCLSHMFNSHNQYASLFLNGGILILLLFIISMIYSMMMALKMSNYLYLFFLILFTINLLSESMLIRIHGILFYSIFNSLFFATGLKEKFHILE
ncbi:O-antigen ligase family protein [uncultured Maribacter sp.]|uniref:O-antigen ligase family protein n=1 Tax=uncultured Maribacter sp. TaxID=431308 RepID=UPI0026329BAB|nr:O-antigen ligase family protein [uncultured Maribacter sp.]